PLYVAGISDRSILRPGPIVEESAIDMIYCPLAEAGFARMSARRSAESKGISFNAKSLAGHVGVIFARQDATALIKGVVKYGEENDSAVTVLGGHIDGAVCTAADVEAIAKLPDINTMRAQFLGLLEAPMAQNAQVVQAVLASVLYCLEEKGKQG
ncbi:hypothetical protein ACFLR2_02505, partial [Chlamydiota bacterium]